MLSQPGLDAFETPQCSPVWPFLSPRQERIKELEKIIRMRIYQIGFDQLIQDMISQGIPKEELPVSMDDYRDWSKMFRHHPNTKYQEAFYNATNRHFEATREPSIAQTVLDNIAKTRVRGERLLGTIDGDITFEAFELFHEVIDTFPILPDFDENTQALGRDYAHMHIDAWMEELQQRKNRLSDNDFFGEREKSELSMKEQYELLTTIANSTGEVQDCILQRLSEMIPTHEGMEFSWEELKEFIDEVVSAAGNQ